MFWKYNNATSNHIETLLNNQDVTLQELMDEEDILQECKSQNKKLVEFLGRLEIMEQLVTLTTLEPTEEIDEKIRFKYPNIACELLTSDVPLLNERLCEEENLTKLYAFLEGEAPLNPLLASFFSKTVGILVARRSEQNWYSYQFTCLKALQFLMNKENCISLLLKHLGTSAIMDLMLKIMTQIEGTEIKQNLISWLKRQNVIPALIDLLDPSVDSERHCNVSQLLSDIIRKARENVTSNSEPCPILSALESPETVTQILDNMLNGEKVESSVVGGIAVLLTLIEPPKPRGPEAAMYNTMAGIGIGSTEDTTIRADGEDVPIVVQTTIAAILPRLKDLHELLLNPPQKPAVKTTVGTLDPPLGNTRLQVARLISALVATNTPAINQELANLNTIEVLLDLFFKYQWNNFLHTQVEQCLASALSKQAPASYAGDGEAPNSILIEHVLVKCQLLKRILDAWDDSETNQANEGYLRKGYMGHLIKIANHIVNQVENGSLGTIMKEKVPSEILSAWESFVSGSLAEVNKTHNIALGGLRPTQSMGLDKEEANYKNIPFPTDTSLNQAFTDYQLQEMAPSFIENYGFHDNDFNDGDDTLHSSVDRLPGMTFGLNEDEEDLDRQAELFKHVCAKKLNSLEDAEENVWEGANQLGSFHTSENPSRKWQNDKDGADNSSSDEEEEEEEEKDDDEIRRPRKNDIHMEVDTTDIWSSGAATINTASDFGNPWGAGEAIPPADAFASTDAGWADFSSFETNFSSSTQLHEDKQSHQQVAFTSPATSISTDLSGCENSMKSVSNDENTPSASTVSEVQMNSASGTSEASSSNSSEMRVVIESDANANPTTTVEDVTPTATALVDEVASAAVAAVKVVVADKLELDNQRFLEEVQSETDVASSESGVEEVPDSTVSDNSREQSETQSGTSEEAPSKAV